MVPIVSVVVTVVEGALALTCLTQTVSPAEIVPAVVTKDPLHPLEYDPPVTLIGVETVMPEIVTALEVLTVDMGTDA
jgi:hypothetical protein